MIKAIETQWKGYRFRSRLEARWAVFFEELGLRWEYEPEGFALGDAGWYLPDFYLPDLSGGVFVEVKPSHNDDDIEAKAKIEALCAMTKKFTLLASGAPDQCSYLAYEFDGGKPQEIDVCFQLKYLPPRLHDDKPRLFYMPGGIEDSDCFGAIIAARSARFEHGEKPTIRKA